MTWRSTGCLADGDRKGDSLNLLRQVGVAELDCISMFSRLFSSKPKPSTEQPVAAGRSLSPSTESASVSASAATAAPGSPTRVALPPSRTPSPDPGPAALHSLISTCPPKTLYAYTLPRLELGNAVLFPVLLSTSL